MSRLCHAPIRIGPDGIIEHVVLPGEADHAEAVAAAERGNRLLRLDGYRLPGLMDLHVQAPQYCQLGHVLDLSLEDWLHRHTFALESFFTEATCDALVGDLLAGGTTTAVYSGTPHGPAMLRPAGLCVAHGLRAMVGRVAMHRSELCSGQYRDPDAAAACGR